MRKLVNRRATKTIKLRLKALSTTTENITIRLLLNYHFYFNIKNLIIKHDFLDFLTHAIHVLVLNTEKM